MAHRFRVRFQSGRLSKKQIEAPMIFLTDPFPDDKLLATARKLEPPMSRAGPNPQADDQLAEIVPRVLEQREALRQLLDELPPEQAEALAMHCVLGCTVEETAAATGVPINTVRGRLVTAKSALRKILAENSELSDLLRGAS